MLYRLPVILLLMALMPFCVSTREQGSPFHFSENEQGLEIMENGQPVFFYQRAPKTLGTEYICNNYVHPLYSLDGDTLTEVSPSDHLNHRGIFWAWHQVFAGEQRVSNGWVMEDLSLEVDNVKSNAEKERAILELSVLWKSPNFQNSDPFIRENTTITVHRQEAGIRMIDFEILLNALVAGVSLGGSENEKGYGGFCTRMRMPDDLVFTSENGPVIPQTLQVQAGPWMDFSGSFSSPGEISGITLLCHPETPNFPAPWILRQKGSMQNIVFPGQDRIELTPGKPVVLKYRLIIHRGGPSTLNIPEMLSDYK